MRYLTNKGLRRLAPFCLGLLAVAAVLMAGLGWVCILHPLWLMLGLGGLLLLIAAYVAVSLSWAIRSGFRSATTLGKRRREDARFRATL